MSQAAQLAQLRENLDRLFDLEELRSLCSDLNVDYDNLRGETKKAKAEELVGHMERRGRLRDLVTRCRELRPKVEWPDVEPPPPQSQIHLLPTRWRVIGTVVGAIAVIALLAILSNRLGLWPAPMTPTASLTFAPRTSPPTVTLSPVPTKSPSPTATATPSATPSPTPTPTPDPKLTLMALIEAEKQAALIKNMDLIRKIFAPNATKTDAAGRQSWTAIQRYADTFPTEDYSEITHTNFEFDIADNKAIVTNDSCGSFTLKTTGQRIEINCPQCDQWTFKRDASGRWWIMDFTYGLVSTAPSHQYTFEDGTTGCWVIRSDNNVLQGQTVISTTELAHQGRGSLRFAFDLAQVLPAHRGQIIRNQMPFTGEASAYIYAPPDAPSDLVAGFFAMELDHDPFNYHAADQMVKLEREKWTRVTWNVSVTGWAQPLHLLGIEVRRAGGGDYRGYVLIDDVLIESR